ncbi:hypothetical protein ACWGQ5_13055 [Streptomyces sp. NPDC055722]
MSHLTPGIFRARPERPVAVAAPRAAWQRAAYVLLAVGLDVGATVMLLSRHLPSAVAGVFLAGLGWFATGRITTWHPASSLGAHENSARR